MLSSMTGFGKSDIEADGSRVSVEIRTVNGRYGDVSVHLPRYLSEFEPRIKELVLGRIARGRVDVSISYQSDQATQGTPTLNEAVADAYVSELTKLVDRGVAGEPTLTSVASLPNVFSFETPEVDVDEVWGILERGCESAVNECHRMRQVEGAKLADDFRGRIETLNGLISKVEELAPTRVESAKKRLKEKLEALLTPEAVDQSRVMMEIAILADRSDITEECVRFHSHNEQFLDTLDRGESVGRRLNFLLQEMLREANTIGSKAGNAEIAHIVVEMKEEIEKLKEQVLNVE
ncbi:TPA: YicC family protein [Candidatus Latescibacteria bacterium]|nr:YicC family protein [Candidatus Latescibacterota bacterium]